MLHIFDTAEQSEARFVELVGARAGDSSQRRLLAELLREDHPFYHQRSAATVVQMRGWVLLALARTGISDQELPFILEEFDAGMDAYLVGAAARALRSYSHPSAALIPFVMRALVNVHDEPLSFEGYGEYATHDTGTTPIRELLAVLAWLGPHARTALPELASLRTQPGRLSSKQRAELDRVIAVIRGADHNETECCTLPPGLGQRWWATSEREDTQTVEAILFEDQDGIPIRFREFFHGRISIVVFFYTRCDNPWKCSLTITKLARVQQLLQKHALADQIQTAAITYDPSFDIPRRLCEYGRDRGLRFDAHHRMFRAVKDFSALRDHFNLGVNFIESLVNRHRIELYILDNEGRVSCRFERLLWDEFQVVARGTEVLRENAADCAAKCTSASSVEPSAIPVRTHVAVTVLGTLASLAWVVFPKCPMCWAAYLSVFGIGIRQIPSPSKMEPLLAAMMLINLISVGLRAWATRRMSGFYLVCTGSMAIILSKIVVSWSDVAIWGVGLTLAGTLWNAVNRSNIQFSLSQIWMRVNRKAGISEKSIWRLPS
jgi:protein SCO1/2